MDFDQEIKEKINILVKEQVRFYIKDIEKNWQNENPNYSIHKSKKHIYQRKDKLFECAENELTNYIINLMNNSIKEGCTEEEAFKKAEKEVKFQSSEKKNLTINERIIKIIRKIDIRFFEALGIFYALAIFCCIIIGLVVGFVVGGGSSKFAEFGWINTLFGTYIGLLVGLGLCFIVETFHASKMRTKKKKK